MRVSKFYVLILTLGGKLFKGDIDQGRILIKEIQYNPRKGVPPVERCENFLKRYAQSERKRKFKFLQLFSGCSELYINISNSETHTFTINTALKVDN